MYELFGREKGRSPSFTKQVATTLLRVEPAIEAVRAYSRGTSSPPLSNDLKAWLGGRVDNDSDSLIVIQCMIVIDNILIVEYIIL